jgi:trans-aconitate 3-methyltransferase
MEKQMRWRDLLGYFRTWSSLHKYHTQFPEDLKRVDTRFPEDFREDLAPGIDGEGRGIGDIDVSGGDIAVRFWKDLREGVKNQGGKFGVDETVVVEWPIALLLAKRA